MFDVEKYVQEWFERNGMGPLFALSEFCKLHKIEATVSEREVRFLDEKSHTDIARLLDGCVFEIGTWKLLRNLNVSSSTSFEEQPKSVRVSKK